MNKWLAKIVVSWSLLLATAAVAHPHVWIDLRVTPVVDVQGRLTALQQAWRFDPFYSLVLLEELEQGGPLEEIEQRYDQLAQEVVANLSRVDFFTHLQQKSPLLNGQQQQLKFAPVTSFTLLRIGQRLEFGFELPLQQPVALNGVQLEYKVYDPGYYIEIVHAQEQGFNAQALPATCKAQLHAPNPSRELIEQAYALDVDEVAQDPQLGVYFAEQLLLNCL